MVKRTGTYVTGKVVLDRTLTNSDVSDTAKIGTSKVDVKCGLTEITGSAEFPSGLSSVKHCSASLDAVPGDDASFAVGRTSSTAGNVILYVYKTAAVGGFSAATVAKMCTWVAWRPAA